MRLALIRQKYTPFGGAERFVERALGALTEQQVDITLITREWREPQPGAQQSNALICDPFYLGRLWRDMSFARCVRGTIDRENFDLVQSHERIPGCDIYRAGDGVHATWLEQRSRVQSAVQRLATRLHPWHRYTLAAEARLFRDPRLRAVICNSRMVRDDIARRFDVATEKLHVIHNGVDLEQFHPRLRAEQRASMRGKLGISEGTPLFLTVGSGFERKGVPQLLAACAAMHKHEGKRVAMFLIVGKDKRLASAAQQAKRLGVEHRVLFLGGQPDVRPFYAAADAFVLPTLYDPFPNASLEALACGLPLITSLTCGAQELVQPGVNGFVCDALDIAALSVHLDTLAAPDAAAAMRDAARASVAGFSNTTMAKHLITLYRDLLRSH